MRSWHVLVYMAIPSIKVLTKNEYMYMYIG